jgi:Coiled-coil domain-containing protein 66
MNYQKSQGGGRAKWGSYLFDSFSKDNGRSSRNTNGPVWLEKSLSEARDSEEETMSISVRSVASFLRGQNVPVDPQVLAERESKRRKAMELQQAIKNQLQERENFKKMEKEKQYQIDRMEEERLAKQMDLERKRLEYEQNLQYEKLEAERKREEAMRKALEKAALEAQMDRERKRRERVAMQNTVDETICIQKIGEKMEIIIDQKSTSGYETPSTVENHEIPQTPAQESDFDDEDDGETVLIGTPIKLKKKNLDTFRRKFHKRQQNAEDSKNTSDDEVSTPKTAKSVESNNEKNQAKQTAKVLSELDGIALVLQSMPFVPLSNDIFGFNQLNNLALLMAAQNRLNSPNLMLPIISKDMTTTAAINGSDKLDLSQFLIPQNNQQTITLQIQQVETKQAVSNDNRANIQSVPPTPDQQSRDAQTSMETKPIEIVKTAEKVIRSIPQTPSESSVQPTRTPLPHDATFTKEECHTHDAFTSTSTENRFVDEEREVKILTPQKYRNETRLRENMKTISTQTESFLFCEYCSYQHQQHHQHHCSGHTTTEETDTNPNSIQAEIKETDSNRSKEKKSENRPLWGARNPPIKYLKASERDPFYGKNRKKRYLKKAASESEKTDDTCALRDCPLIKSSTPSLPKLSEKFSRDNLCRNMLPIKYDRFGNCKLLMDPDNFVMHEAFRRVHRTELYASQSDCESSIDIKQKSFFFPKANDFQDIFVD